MWCFIFGGQYKASFLLLRFCIKSMHMHWWCLNIKIRKIALCEGPIHLNYNRIHYVPSFFNFLSLKDLFVDFFFLFVLLPRWNKKKSSKVVEVPLLFLINTSLVKFSFTGVALVHLVCTWMMPVWLFWIFFIQERKKILKMPCISAVLYKTPRRWHL